ncbi:hypothetical protein HY086_04275 [Candidatus Gottesmanbacteria bacterium]|nr:hypothetical protein [Candidatus Gottesmanbacteria bacterium]
MNKDALLATLIGLGMGLIITGIIVVGPNLLKALPKISLPKFNFNLAQKPGAPTPTPTPTVFAVTIESPVADSVVSKEELLVSGSTFAGAMVVVQGPTDEDVVSSDTNGKYAGKVTLSEGKNDVTVTSYLAEKHDSKTVVVFYIQ